MDDPKFTTPPLASREELFANAFRRRFKELTLPVSGLRVRIRSLSEPELSAYSCQPISADGAGKVRKARLEDATRRLICLSLADADGNRLLSDADAPSLAQWDSADTQYLRAAIAPFVGLQRGDVEDLVKNSDAIRAAG